jgi:hypothetical protein
VGRVFHASSAPGIPVHPEKRRTARRWQGSTASRRVGSFIRLRQGTPQLAAERNGEATRRSSQERRRAGLRRNSAQDTPQLAAGSFILTGGALFYIWKGSCFRKNSKACERRWG